MIFSPVSAIFRAISTKPGLGKTTLLIAVCAFLSSAVSTNALAKGKPDPGGPGLQLIISEVFLTDPFDLDDDPDNQLMDIFGADFDPGDDPLVVTLGMWDLTDDCALIGPDFDHIRCNLPADGVGVAGDYLVKVSHGLGQSEGDEYDLTIAEPPVPEGTIAFYAATACPPGWDEYTAARGLAIVGLPESGTVAGGSGTPMDNNEDRTGHTHEVDFGTIESETEGAHDHTGQTGPGGAHSHGGATKTAQASDGVVQKNVDTCTSPGDLLSNCPVLDQVASFAISTHSHDINSEADHQHTVAQEGDHSHDVVVGSTTSQEPSKEDVLPYIQLLACVKGCISDCGAE